MSYIEPPSCRSFLKSVATASALPVVATTRLGPNVYELARGDEPPEERGPNDRIRIATIGMGIIGFIDTDTALRVPGVELVAAVDLYQGRRIHSKEVYGDHVAVSVDYREVLGRKDVDAVLVCVPDHWHARIAIDAMRAGKAVYCEKPIVRLVEEGPEVIAVQKETGAVFQVGSQYASSVLYDKVKSLVKEGAIGRSTSIERDATATRRSAPGSTRSRPTPRPNGRLGPLPGAAPGRPFDPVRFFRWRNYWEYGTAVAGDLFVHLLTGIHHVTGALGPTRIAGMGGRRTGTTAGTSTT